MDRSNALECARLWIGTPYILGQSLRGVGCDCVGLVRGVWSDHMGVKAPRVPPWRADWANSAARPLVSAARQYLVPLEDVPPAPGDVVVLRLHGTREAHCGILEEGDQFIHATEGVGVVRVPFASFRPAVSFAAAFPSP